MRWTVLRTFCARRSVPLVFSRSDCKGLMVYKKQAFVAESGFPRTSLSS